MLNTEQLATRAEPYLAQLDYILSSFCQELRFSWQSSISYWPACSKSEVLAGPVKLYIDQIIPRSQLKLTSPFSQLDCILNSLFQYINFNWLHLTLYSATCGKNKTLTGPVYWILPSLFQELSLSRHSLTLYRPAYN